MKAFLAEPEAVHVFTVLSMDDGNALVLTGIRAQPALRRAVGGIRFTRCHHRRSEGASWMTWKCAVVKSRRRRQAADIDPGAFAPRKRAPARIRRACCHVGPDPIPARRPPAAGNGLDLRRYSHYVKYPERGDHHKPSRSAAASGASITGRGVALTVWRYYEIRNEPLERKRVVIRVSAMWASGRARLSRWARSSCDQRQGRRARRRGA